jgi:hypothetical protein
MTHRDEYQARNDASLAQHARQTPGPFARMLNRLTGQERRNLEERLTRGQAWLARNGSGQTEGDREQE